MLLQENGVKEEKPSTPRENGDIKTEGDSPEANSEKENKDTNGVETKSEVKSSDIKGKGKGKGKGKSSQVKSKLDPETVAEAAAVLSPASRAERRKKTAAEIYTSLLETTPGSGDEDSEDSEDEEFGAGQ